MLDNQFALFVLLKRHRHVVTNSFLAEQNAARSTERDYARRWISPGYMRSMNVRKTKSEDAIEMEAAELRPGSSARGILMIRRAPCQSSTS